MATNGTLFPESDATPALLEAKAEAARLRLTIRALLRNVNSGAGKCDGCGATILWVKHASGANTPYDSTGINHFATCPKRQQFHRKGEPHVPGNLPRG